jgi:hypothetical protein
MGDINKVTETPGTLAVHVVIDASNLLHQAQTEVPKLLGNGRRDMRNLAIYYPSLVTCILGGRPLLDKAVIVTSTPSWYEESWKALPADKFTWLDFPRQFSNDGSAVIQQEKGNDVAVALEAIIPSCNGKQCILALVAGDGDYTHLARVMLERGWQVEIHFWNSESCGAWRCMEYVLTETLPCPTDVAGRLKKHVKLKIMPTLTNTFEKFVFVYTAGEESTPYFLQVTHHEAATLRHDQLFQLAMEWGSFVQMTNMGGGHINFHFCKEDDMMHAMGDLKKRKPEWNPQKGIPWTPVCNRSGKRAASDSASGSQTSKQRLAKS